MKTAIICANGLEECEALVTYDLLFRAGIDVKLVGFEPIIVSSHNVSFKADFLLQETDLNDFDCLVLPGGLPGTNNLETNPIVQKAIDDFISANKLIGAICAAPSILIHKGLLNDNEFTCYPGFEGDKKRVDVKAMQTRNIITGNGLGGANEFASIIIDNLVGNNKGEEILEKIQYK